jgi:hypothetical protein
VFFFYYLDIFRHKCSYLTNAGAFGTVWLADRETAVGVKQCAVKMLRNTATPQHAVPSRESFDGLQWQLDFLQEMECMARLSHPVREMPARLRHLFNCALK